MANYIEPFKGSPDALPDDMISLYGGKGASLIQCTRHNLPVPDGFVITTNGYNAVIETSQELRDVIEKKDSTKIKDKFESIDLPDELRESIISAYHGLSGSSPAVAVRSSATTEDLPTLSFAGQQDTFLSIVGDEAVIRSVQQTWASLYTERAIAYRQAHSDLLDLDHISIAVVVQLLVPSVSSGVLFTANPLNGIRHECVIDAVRGLGELLVSGAVTPDHFVVDCSENEMKITKRDIQPGNRPAERAIEGGGTEMTEMDTPSLSDEQVLSVADLGMRVVEFMKTPQDIEWGIGPDGAVQLLQSRPITSLYPVPHLDGTDTIVYWNAGIKQGILEPSTPLGHDTYTFGYHTIVRTLIPDMKSDLMKMTLMGGRSFLVANPLMNNKLIRYLVNKNRDKLDPAVSPVFLKLIDDDSIFPKERRTAVWPVLKAIFGPLRDFKKCHKLVMEDPDAYREKFVAVLDGDFEFSKKYAADAETIEDPIERFKKRLGLISIVWKVFSLYENGVLMYAVIFGGHGSLLKLGEWASKYSDLGDGRNLTANEAHGILQGGVPYNPTTEMDMEIYRSSARIRDDEDSRVAFGESVDDITSRFLSESLPHVAQHEIQHIIDEYGFRAWMETDLGRPRWKDEPQRVITNLRGLVHLEFSDEHPAPDVKFEQQAKAADDLYDRLLERSPWWRKRKVRKLYNAGRKLMGTRDYPKMHMIRCMDIARESLFRNGEYLVEHGYLDDKRDVVHLHLNELNTMLEDDTLSPADYKQLVCDRKLQFKLEEQRKQIPLAILSTGEVFYMGSAIVLSTGEVFYMGSTIDAADGLMKGVPVSPGVVEGRVNVVKDPMHADLQSGDIMVCRGTDPSWTPLFMAIKGLIMETGGMMTHGSVVAREYGIPCVIGVMHATLELKSGQMIKLDAINGTIEILDDSCV